MSANNSIVIVGIIKETPTYSHSANGEKFYSGTIVTRRKSGAYDELSILLSEYFMEEKIVNQKIKISGEIRTHNIQEKLIVSAFVQDIMFVDEYDMDEVTLNGYICKKSNLRITSVSNRKIISFILATSRIYGKTDYIPCICWGDEAKRIAEAKVGSNIKLKGRLQSRKYIKDETEFTTYEMSVNKVS